LKGGSQEPEARSQEPEWEAPFWLRFSRWRHHNPADYADPELEAAR
jgi:hypothetical protein